jgi:hypothetical protein
MYIQLDDCSAADPSMKINPLPAAGGWNVRVCSISITLTATLTVGRRDGGDIDELNMRELLLKTKIVGGGGKRIVAVDWRCCRLQTQQHKP